MLLRARHPDGYRGYRSHPRFYILDAKVNVSPDIFRQKLSRFEAAFSVVRITASAATVFVLGNLENSVGVLEHMKRPDISSQIFTITYYVVTYRLFLLVMH